MNKVFSIEFSDPFHNYTDSNVSVLVGPIFIDTIRRAVSSAIASSRYYERSVDSVHVHGNLTNSLSIVREESYSHKTDISIANQLQVSWTIINNMVCSHRYPLLPKSTQPPIPYWTQKIILCPRDNCTSAELNYLLFLTGIPWHTDNIASIRLICE